MSNLFLTLYDVSMSLVTDDIALLISRSSEKECRLIAVTQTLYKDAEKSLVRPTSRCILFDGQNISFDASLVIYINSTNIPPIIIINRIYETENLLSV
jgi:hypothetical protein